MKNTNEIEYNISTHAKQRYVERLIGKDNKNDVSRFIVENEEKIKTDINKMIKYGSLLYIGKQSQKDGKGKVLNVYLKDTYVVLVDTSSNIVITLYKISLGLDEEFNKVYISKMVEKLNERKKALEDVQLQVQNESNMYKNLIDETEIQIKEYKSMLKNLEELCVGYKTIIDNNIVRVSQANKDVADVVNQLINKKEF